MRILDLFCKAGGAGMGYAQAGFEVVGVDIKYQKRYPFTFIQADAIEVMRDVAFLRTFDAIHASPPCQTHSITKNLRDAQGGTTDKVDCIPITRELLNASSVPYIIENVPGAPLSGPVLCCGSYFGLKVRRHRIFESTLPIVGTECKHKAQGKPVGIYGAMNDNPQGVDRTTGRYVYGGSTAKTIEEAREAMGIDWMIWAELVEAIPPAYTEFLGTQIMMALIQNKNVA